MLTEQERFLLRTLTGSFNRDLGNALDIENFYKLTKDYRLLHFLYLRLADEGSFRFAPKIMKELKEFYMLNLKMCLRQRKEALKIADAFNKKDVPAVFLKGALLGERIYQKEGTRSGSIDIDLLIRYGDMLAVEELLTDLGYEIDHYRYQWLERSMAQVNCVSGDEGTLIELHWGPFHKYEWDNIVPLSEYWSNGLNRDIDGVRVRFLSNEMLFIYLCLVLCKEKEKGSRIKYLLDLHFFLLRYKDGVDYSYLARMVSCHGLKPYLSFCLDVLGEGFGLDYGIKQRLLEPIEVGASNKIIFKLVMDKKRDITRKKSSLLKQNIINLFLFSRGSFWVMVNKIYSTYKSSYLRFLERKDLRPSLITLVGHFLGLYKNLSG